MCPATALRPAAQQLREMRRPICELERPKTVPCPCPGPTGRIASSLAIVVTLRYRSLPPEVWSVFERRTVSLPVPSAIRSTRGLRLRSVSVSRPAWRRPGRCRRGRAPQRSTRAPLVPIGIAVGAWPGGGLPNILESPAIARRTPGCEGSSRLLSVWAAGSRNGTSVSHGPQNGPKRQPNLNCSLSCLMF